MMLATSEAVNPTVTTKYDYVAIGPLCFGFGDSREEAIKNCSFNLPWGVSKVDEHTVWSYAYLPEQDLTVSEIDGSMSWYKADAFDVKASKQETVVKKPTSGDDWY